MDRRRLLALLCAAASFRPDLKAAAKDGSEDGGHSGGDGSGSGHSGGDAGSHSGNGSTSGPGRDDTPSDDDHGPGPGHPAQGPASGQGGRSARTGDDAEVIAVGYADGSSVRIDGRRYIRRDATGRIVEARRSTPGDRVRLPSRPGEVTITIDDGGAISTVDRRGWRERMADGLYVLTDPRGRTVKRRRLRAEDTDRIRAITG